VGGLDEPAEVIRISSVNYFSTFHRGDMPAKRKINLTELDHLLRSGVPMTAIARTMQVSKGAISKASKRLGLSVAKGLVLPPARVNESNLSAMEKITVLMRAIEAELHYTQEAMKDVQGDARMKWQDALLKHVDQARKLLVSLKDIALALYSVNEYEEFKRIILNEISNESQECRDRIWSRIKQARDVRGFDSIGGPGI
jgi:hypothetical protein